MRALVRWLGWLALGALASAGCKSGTEPQVGSESHFLVSCSMSCDAGFECLCGVCTQRCEADATCQELHAGAACVPTAERPEESSCADDTVPAFCDVRCELAADCTGLGPGFTCRAGFCRQDALGSQARDGRIDVDELCDFYVNDVCDAKVQCYDWPYRDREECLAAQECDGWNEFNQLLDSGAVSFDPVATYDCHQRLLADPCALGTLLFVPELSNALKACGALTGQIPEGGACGASGAECAPGTGCDFSTCPSVCKRDENLGVGEACLLSICLDDREHCSQCAVGLVCADGVCRPEWQLGEACATSIDCQPNLWCNRTAGECQPVAQLGETCSDFQEDAPPCAEGLWCDGPTFETGQCQPKGGAGSACQDDLDCLEPFSCWPTSDPMLGVCGEKRADGEACDSYDDCQSGLCATDRCAPQPTLGESCVSECAEGFSCPTGSTESVCVAERYPGESCADGSQCLLSRCEAGVCTVRRHLGQACAVDDDCLSDDCVGGVCIDGAGCE